MFRNAAYQRYKQTAIRTSWQLNKRIRIPGKIQRYGMIMQPARSVTGTKSGTPEKE
jgi:hypothetical protein